jgi:GNAT superfamily N-acetyltransferase
MRAGWSSVLEKAIFVYPDPSMTIFTFRLKRLDEIPTAERLRVDEIDHATFDGSTHGLEWRTPEWMLLGYADGAQVAQIGLLACSVQVGMVSVRVTGIGGVATDAAWRGKGYAQVLMGEAARVAREQMETGFGLLACEPGMVPFYARLGWQVVGAPVWIVSGGVRQTLPMPSMVLTLGERAWPDGTVDLGGAPW